MRSKARIDPVIEKLREVWKNHPDMRFGQLIMNIAPIRYINGSVDIWYMEEDELLERLEEFDKALRH